MNTSKLSILLYTDKSKLSKKGQCPIKCRLTYLKTRKQFSTGLFVNPTHWNSKKQKVLDDTAQSDYLNKQLSLIINKINQAFLMLQIQEVSFSVEEIYSAYKGEKLAKEYNVVEYFEVFLKRFKRLVGIEIKGGNL